MNIFEVLSREVEQAWAAAGQKLEVFPEIATRALENFKYDLSQEQLDEALAEWFLKTDKIPNQINVHNTFGQPPITIFNNSKFVVDIYIWLDFDTSIHSHGFRGAFRVLHGKSLHEKFTLKTLEEISADVMITDLGVPEMNLLYPGDVHTILPGKELTHRVVHLENPTVTLCVKTINEPTTHQWNYFPNGLAIQKRHVDGGLIKQLYYFQYLMGQSSGLGAAFLEKIIDRTDISTLMNLSEDVISGGYDLRQEVAEYFLGQVVDRHGESEWFQAYHDLTSLAENELHFEHCESALERLLGHFVNCGLTLETAEPYLSKLAGKKLTAADIRAKLQSLTKDDRFFGGESKQQGQLKKIKDFLG
jgi:hypothetical protein